jgi:hypothetical protein
VPPVDSTFHAARLAFKPASHVETTIGFLLIKTDLLINPGRVKLVNPKLLKCINPLLLIGFIEILLDFEDKQFAYNFCTLVALYASNF